MICGADGKIVPPVPGSADDNGAYVFRPEVVEGMTFPLIAFGHGLGGGGDGIEDIANNGDIKALVSQGFVVLAYRAGVSAGCASTVDQINSLEWAKATESDIHSYVDWSYPVGIMGYSMGGLATLNTASSEETVKRLNIGAAALLEAANPKAM